jgi:hypothetical protein
LGVLDALLGRGNGGNTATTNRSVTQPVDRSRSELQGRIREFWGSPRPLSYVDMHQRDGYPDSILAPAGGRYMGVQALSLRDPDDTRWLLDSQGTPIWLRSTTSVREANRIALSPQPAISPFSLEAWHVASSAGVPNVGNGPGSVMTPLPQLGNISQVSD